jgi:DNA-binding LacI/PurR family transcriptional regulator
MAATLKDVAAHAGVSIKTVSNVVHDHQRVAAQTRERVRTAIEALNNRPNLSARHLRKARVGVLALALPDIANTSFSDIGNAVIAAAAHPYTVLLDHTGGDCASEIRVAHGRRPPLIDGVILSPLAVQMADLQPRRVGVPMVLLGELLLSAPWDHSVGGNVSAARTATAHVLRLLTARRLAVDTTDRR